MNDTGLERIPVEAWTASSLMLKSATDSLGEEHKDEQDFLNNDGWPFFYAMVRQGLASNLDGLLLKSSEDWTRTWQNARAVNRVPDNENIPTLCEILNLIKNIHQLDPSKNIDNPFARVLTSISIDVPNSVALDALAIVQNQGMENPDALLTLRDKHPNETKAINALVRGLRIDQLTQKNTALFVKLNGRLDGDSDTIQPLAKLAISEWLDLSDQTSANRDHVLQIQVKLEKDHPVTALKSRLEKGEIELPNNSSGEISAMIKQDSAKVEAILSGKTRAIIDDKTPETHKTLQNLGRFVNTGLNMEMAAHLINSGVSSPAAAIRYGKAFVSEELGKKYKQFEISGRAGRYVDHIEQFSSATSFAWQEMRNANNLPSWFSANHSSDTLTQQDREKSSQSSRTVWRPR